MKEDIRKLVTRCEVCGCVYLESEGETCKCPTPFDDEPVVVNWEDVDVRQGV